MQETCCLNRNMHFICTHFQKKMQQKKRTRYSPENTSKIWTNGSETAFMEIRIVVVLSSSSVSNVWEVYAGRRRRLLYIRDFLTFILLCPLI